MTPKLKNETQKVMNQAMEGQETCNCQKCGTVYQIKFLKPDENYNDFGIWFCPYCGDLTESFPHWVKIRKLETCYVLITLSGGLIDQVKFYEEAIAAVTALSGFVKTMDVENEDAGVYGKDRLISNAKDFLDENDEFTENSGVFERI